MLRELLTRVWRHRVWGHTSDSEVIRSLPWRQPRRRKTPEGREALGMLFNGSTRVGPGLLDNG